VAGVQHQRTSVAMAGEEERHITGAPGDRDSRQNRDATVRDGAEAPLSGLSRMIRELFPPSPAPVGRGRWSSAGAHPLRARFTTRVARYLQGGASQRDRLVAGILDDGASLSEAGEAQAVAQAFSALVRRATRRTSALSTGERGNPAQGVVEQGVAAPGTAAELEGRAAERSAGTDGVLPRVGIPTAAPHLPGDSDEGGPGADRDMLALAAELAGNRAAVQVIEDLVTDPEGEGVSELLVVAATFPERMHPVLSTAMATVTDVSVQQILARIQTSVREAAGPAVHASGERGAPRLESQAGAGGKGSVP